MAGFNINDLLNAKSKGAAVQAEGPAEQEQEFKVTMLDVEDLMPSKDNFYSTENIDELATSIELVGHIEQNLVVKPEAHGKYEVVAGHRRRLAALKLVQEGKEEYRKVPCLIKKESDTIKDKLSLIFTNATARQLTDWEKVQQAKELKEIIYVFLTIFLYLPKCPQSLILSALRAFCFCGKPRISRSIFLYFPCQSWLKSW